VFWKRDNHARIVGEDDARISPRPVFRPWQRSFSLAQHGDGDLGTTKVYADTERSRVFAQSVPRRDVGCQHLACCDNVRRSNPLMAGKYQQQ
jgi:hypothetical protein